MRHVYPDTLRRELSFMEKAAAHFATHPQHWTYTDGEVESSCLLALRWGLGNDCVLVVKLSDMHHPTIYAQVIQPAPEANAP